jgi:hypothetical protein
MEESGKFEQREKKRNFGREKRQNILFSTCGNSQATATHR